MVHLEKAMAQQVKFYGKLKKIKILGKKVKKLWKKNSLRTKFEKQ
jgi:hypothetical protein